MEPSNETRIAVLETEVKNLVNGHTEIVSEQRSMRNEITQLKVVIARWGGGLMVVNVIAVLGSRYLPVG